MRIQDIEWTLGADPEIFLHNKTTKAFVSAHDRVPGSKKEPHKLSKVGDVQPDGTALEIGIKPARTRLGFRSRLKKTVEDAMAQIGDDNLTYVFHPSADFDPKYFDEAVPESAKVLGCDPDFDAYRDGAENPIPDHTAAPNRRFAGGHVHVGWTNGVAPKEPSHLQACCYLSKQLDIYLGVPSLFWDKDSERRRVYGQPGRFRPKPYGMEYRTLSNAWLKHTRLINFVYDQTTRAITDLLNDDKPKFEDYGDMARMVMETENLELAMHICTELGFEVPKPPKAMIRKKGK